MEGINASGEINEDARQTVSELLKRSFRPEFLNRLDEIVFYKPLTKENINGIVDLLIADLNKRLKDKQITVKISDSAKQFIIDSAYDPTYGARPLKRFIQSRIETLLAREIIGGDIEPDTTLEIDCEESSLVIK